MLSYHMTQIYFHSSMDSLHEHLPKDSLPEWLGGPLKREEAFDQELLQDLLNPERDPWYRRINYSKSSDAFENKLRCGG
jgi:hypothetical protein